MTNTIIFGGARTGKTSLAFELALARADKVYTFRFPNPEAVEKTIGDRYGGNLVDIAEVYSLPPESAIIFDEAHKHFNAMTKRVNQSLKDVLSTSEQAGIVCIFTTHTFDVFPESLVLAYISEILVKKMPQGALELGGKRWAKVLFKDVAPMDLSQVYLANLATGERGWKRHSKNDALELITTAWRRQEPEDIPHWVVTD